MHNATCQWRKSFATQTKKTIAGTHGRVQRIEQTKFNWFQMVQWCFGQGPLVFQCFFCWEMSRKSTAFSVKPPQVTRNEALTNFHYKEKFHCYRHHSKENNYTRWSPLMTTPITLRTHLRPRTKHDSTVVTEETDWGGKKKKNAVCCHLLQSLWSSRLQP